jgi:hypothetical protein
MAIELANFLKEQGYRANVHHRDIYRKRAEARAPAPQPATAGSDVA